MKMLGDKIVAILLAFSGKIWILIVIAVCVISFAFVRNSKRQIVLPDVPIVGLDKATTIEQARERFRHGSKQILSEGYRKVFLQLSISNLQLTQISTKENPSMFQRIWASASWSQPNMWRSSRTRLTRRRIFLPHLLRSDYPLEEAVNDCADLRCRCSKDELLPSEPNRLSIRASSKPNWTNIYVSWNLNFGDWMFYANGLL